LAVLESPSDSEVDVQLKNNSNNAVDKHQFSTGDYTCSEQPRTSGVNGPPKF